jgi:hypothetical protein
MNCTEAGKLGAIARNKNLSKKRRLEISRKANEAKRLKALGKLPLGKGKKMI